MWLMKPNFALLAYLCMALLILVIGKLKNHKLNWYIPVFAIFFPLIFTFVAAEAVALVAWLAFTCALERLRFFGSIAPRNLKVTPGLKSHSQTEFRQSAPPCGSERFGRGSATTLFSAKVPDRRPRVPGVRSHGKIGPRHQGLSGRLNLNWDRNENRQ